MPTLNGNTIVPVDDWARAQPRCTTVLVFAALILASCSQKESACTQAVKAALKRFQSFSVTKIKEDDLEGSAFNGFMIDFRYGEKSYKSGHAYCIYDNNKETAEISDISY